MGELLDPPLHGCLYAWMLNFRKQIQANKVCVYIYIHRGIIISTCTWMFV